MLLWKAKKQLQCHRTHSGFHLVWESAILSQFYPVLVLKLCLSLCFFFRPLSPAAVLPSVAAFLNHLLQDIEAEKMGKGMRACQRFPFQAVLYNPVERCFDAVMKSSAKVFKGEPNGDQWLLSYFVCKDAANLVVRRKQSLKVFSSSSCSVCSQTGSELPPLIGQLCPAALPAVCGQGPLCPAVGTASIL